MTRALFRMKNFPTNQLAGTNRCDSAFSIGRPSFRRALLLGGIFVAVAFTARAEPLTLDEAIQLALERNAQIKVESFGRSIARADWLTAMGRFDPKITFHRSYQEDAALSPDNVIVANLIKTDDYSLTLDGTTPWGMNYSIGGTARNSRYPEDYTNNFATSGVVRITQPLLKGFGFGSNLLGVRIAKADRRIADWQFRQTAIDVVTNVIVTYSDVAYYQQNVRIAQRSRELAAGLLDENVKRFKVGSISESDVTQARAETATQDESILFAQQGLRDAINRLRQLIGETSFPIDPGDLVIVPADPPEPGPVDVAQDLQKALASRPDYQEAKQGIVKRQATDSAARSQLLPQVDFVGSYGYKGLDQDFAASRRMVRDYDNRSYSAGIVVSVPLTFAEGRGQARSARLRLRQAEADLTRLEQDIAVSIAHAAGTLEMAHKRVEANRGAYELSKQALDAEIKKLRAGTSSTFVVLQLQRNLIFAERSFYIAVADLRRAYAAYDRELGRTLEVHNISLAGK
jgi:outer membrane protein TolC